MQLIVALAAEPDGKMVVAATDPAQESAITTSGNQPIVTVMSPLNGIQTAWDTVEADLRSGWDQYEHRRHTHTTWEQMKDAVRDAWDRIVGDKR